METWAWAVLLKPVGAFVLFLCVLIPARMAVERFMKDGRLKRLLLYRFNPE